MSDCEITRFYKTEERVARKEHACCECEAKIIVGERHFVGSGMWDGEISRNRQHLLCEKACELVRDAGMNDDECLAFGELFVWWDSAKDDCWIWDELRTHRDFKKLRQMLYRIRRRERGQRVLQNGLQAR
jgi:hypothetical protein